jgi:DNA-binding GntR family transcriptional regulator
MAAEPALNPLNPLDFPRPKRMSLADEIANTISEAIATRRLKSGERVVELSLVEKLGVSRVPIREALKVLHAQGILTGESHKGYRVAEFDDKTVDNVLEIRLRIETILLRDAIHQWHNGVGDLSGLDEAIRHMEIAAQIGDRLASLNADLLFHNAIRQAAHNDIAATMWDAIARHVMIIFNRENFRDDNLEAIVTQHTAFRDFIRKCVENPPEEEVVLESLREHFLQVARKKTAA